MAELASETVGSLDQQRVDEGEPAPIVGGKDDRARAQATPDADNQRDAPTVFVGLRSSFAAVVEGDREGGGTDIGGRPRIKGGASMDGNVPNQPIYQQPLQSVVDTSQATQEMLKQIEEQNRRNDALLADYAVRINSTSQPR